MICLQHIVLQRHAAIQSNINIHIKLCNKFCLICFPFCNLDGIQVRLADGPHKGIGRIEVLHNGQWGSVCDTNWDDNDALVICKMLSSYPFERYIVFIKYTFEVSFSLTKLNLFSQLCSLTLISFNCLKLNNTDLLAISS
jgi:hypothetical protein